MAITLEEKQEIIQEVLDSINKQSTNIEDLPNRSAPALEDTVLVCDNNTNDLVRTPFSSVYRPPVLSFNSVIQNDDNLDVNWQDYYDQGVGSDQIYYGVSSNYFYAKVIFHGKTTYYKQWKGCELYNNPTESLDSADPRTDAVYIDKDGKSWAFVQGGTFSPIADYNGLHNSINALSNSTNIITNNLTDSIEQVKAAAELGVNVLDFNVEGSNYEIDASGGGTYYIHGNQSTQGIKVKNLIKSKGSYVILYLHDMGQFTLKVYSGEDTTGSGLSMITLNHNLGYADTLMVSGNHDTVTKLVIRPERGAAEDEVLTSYVEAQLLPINVISNYTGS